MFDDFLYRNKWLIGAILIIVIIGGLSAVWWDKVKGAKVVNENQEIAALKTQNDLLREQLSQQSSQSVAGVSAPAENQTDKIDINTASSTELDKLPGIGAVRAADIITYREANGGFKTIEEIKNIKGIGDKSFESLKDLITVGEIIIE